MKRAAPYIRLLLVGFLLYTAFWGLRTPMLQRSVVLFGLMLLTVLSHPSKWRWVDGALVLFIGVSGSFFLGQITPEKILQRGIWGPELYEIWLGVAMVLLLLETTRRVLGWPLVGLSLGFMAYATGGGLLGGSLAHRGFDLTRLISYLVWSPEGIFGTPLGMAASFIGIYILWGCLMAQMGAGEFLLRIAAHFGRGWGGPAKTAVLASGLMGSISGSSVSNVVTTGTFTIPIMKKAGYPAAYAAAVEAAASTGGQIMPPVMGAAAFVMADMTGIPYSRVITASILPALFYVLSIGFMVHLRAERLGIWGGQEGGVFKETLRQGWILFCPVVALLVFLALGWTPLRAGVWAMVIQLCLGCGLSVYKESRLPYREISAAISQAATALIPVGLACAAAGVVIGVVSLTGLGVRISQIILSLSGGSPFLVLFGSMLACLILGMGLPSTAAYIVVATLAGPILINLGVPTLAAHMFVFFFAVLSFITPPVAISSYTAASVAGAHPFQTGWLGLQLGLAGFLIPYLWLRYPGILLEGPWYEILWAVLLAGLGLWALALALEGFHQGPIPLWKRLALLAVVAGLLGHSWTPFLALGVGGLLVWPRQPRRKLVLPPGL